MSRVHARAKARRRALEILHAADVGGEPVPVTTDPQEAFALELVRGVADNRAAIDAAIAGAAEHWTVERMPVVDRNILRIATFEILFTDVPTGAAVDEAVSLAKMLSTEGSGRFVNGVLGRIARDHQDEGRPAEA